MTRCRPSPRNDNPKPAPPEYDPSIATEKISLKNNAFKIGKAFVRETPGIRQEKDDGIYSLGWHSAKPGFIDLRQRLVQVGKST